MGADMALGSSWTDWRGGFPNLFVSESLVRLIFWYGAVIIHCPYGYADRPKNDQRHALVLE